MHKVLPGKVAHPSSYVSPKLDEQLGSIPWHLQLRHPEIRCAIERGLVTSINLCTHNLSLSLSLKKNVKEEIFTMSIKALRQS